MARDSGGPQLVGSARAAAGEVEIDADDDVVAAQMIAATEDEIWREATGLADDDNTGDNSLERMSEGFDDETVEEREAAPEDEPEDGDGEPDDGEDDGAADDVIGDEPDERETLTTREPAPQRQRAPAADPRDDRMAALEREIAELRGARQERDRQAQQRQQADKPGKPDQFADPDGYEKWVLDQATDRAMERFQEQQAYERNQRLNDSFHAASRGDRRAEFKAAYDALAAGPQKGQPGFDAHARAVQNVVNSHDPVGALFSWWEQSGASDDYQASILAQAEAILGRQIAPRRGDRGEQPRGAQNGARSRMPPSLNGRSGSGTHRSIDPEMHNGSESSIFDYATRSN